MDTINYFTSDYITLGLRPYDTNDFENDTDFMEELQKEVDKHGGTLENALDDYIQSCYEDDFENINIERAKHNFYYFHVVIKRGYYEGFALDIESNFSIAFDSWEDKREAQKEITELKQFLIDCAGLGMVKCSPGWCTGYSDYNGTITAIKDAVKEIREEVKQTPTWAQYERECK